MPREGYWKRLKQEDPLKYLEVRRSNHQKYIEKMKTERPEKYKALLRKQNACRRRNK